MALVTRRQIFVVRIHWCNHSRFLRGNSDFTASTFRSCFTAYGGAFIVLSILWGWQVDKIPPDKFDMLGGLFALFGVGIIMYWPRG